MSIAIHDLSSIGPVNLLCDDVKLSFVADGRLTTAGAKAQCSFWNSAGVNMPSTHWLEITWNGITERFTFSGLGTNGNGCEPLGASNGSVWCRDHLAEAFRANYNINRDFDINAPNGVSVNLTARTQEARNLTVTQRQGYNSGVAINVNNLGATPVYRQGYRVIVQTYVQTADGKITMVGEDALSPNEQGYCEGLFGELLRTYVRTDYNTGSGSALVTRQAFNTIKFWFRYGEAWTGDTQRLYKTADYYGIWGGMSTIGKTFMDGMGEWSTFFAIEKMFLTNMPRWTPTTLMAPQRLFWLCTQSGLSQVLVKVRYWGTGGTEQLTLTTISQPVLYGVYEIDAQLRRIFFNLFGSIPETWLRYEITVETPAGVVISGPQGYWVDRSYWIDRPNTRHERYFLFRNSLGGWDTLIARGQQSTSMDVQRYVTEFNASGQRQAWRNEGQITIGQNTGWVKPDYKRYLTELMLSTKVVMLVDGHRAVPIIVTTDSFTVEVDDEQRPTFSFEATPTQRDQYYSKHY